MSGINRAIYEDCFFKAYRNDSSNQKCVFISHKKEDEAAAESVANYIMYDLNMDVYLDKNDGQLRDAVSKGDKQKIVASIQKGISCSDYLICVMSEKTKLSWWVPYEIGYMEKRNQEKKEAKSNIASFMTKDVSAVPEFLEIKEILRNRIDLKRFLNVTNNRYRLNERYDRGDTTYYFTMGRYFD